MPPAEPLAVLALLSVPSTLHVLFDLFALGMFGGFFIVPLYALMQIRSSASHRARIIAANNIVNALFMVVGAMAAAALLASGLSIPALFGIAALCNALVAIYIYRLVPEFLIRFVVWLLVHTIYRLDKRNVEAIPTEGPALLVCNHPSYVDVLVITAACRRPIRFVIDPRFFAMPVLSFLLRQGKAIPMMPATASGPSQPDERCLEAIRTALANGELVAIFPEDGMSNDGEPRKFMPWLNRLLDGLRAPVVPLALSGLWGGPFTRRDPTAETQPAKLRLLRPVTLDVGAPVSALDVSADTLATSVRQLRAI